MNKPHFKRLFYGRVVQHDGRFLFHAHKPDEYLQAKRALQGMQVEFYLDLAQPNKYSLSPYDYFAHVLVPILAEHVGYPSSYACMQGLLGMFAPAKIETENIHLRQSMFATPLEQIKDIEALNRAVMTWAGTPSMITEHGLRFPARETIMLAGADVVYDGNGLPLVEYYLGEQARYLKLDRTQCRLTQTGIGLITKGDNPKFYPAQKKEFDAVLASLLDKEVVVAFWRFYRQRSLLQNAFYWAVIVPIIDWVTKFFNQEFTHELLKWKFLRVESRMNAFGFVRPAFTWSTTQLNTRQFKDYWEKIEAWAAEPGILTEGGITIPQPNQNFSNITGVLAYHDAGILQYVGGGSQTKIAYDYVGGENK